MYLSTHSTHATAATDAAGIVAAAEIGVLKRVVTVAPKLAVPYNMEKVQFLHFSDLYLFNFLLSAFTYQIFQCLFCIIKLPRLWLIFCFNLNLFCYKLSK